MNLVSIVSIKLAPYTDIPNAIGNGSKLAFCLQGFGWCFMHLVPMWPIVFCGLKPIKQDFLGTVIF